MVYYRISNILLCAIPYKECYLPILSIVVCICESQTPNRPSTTPLRQEL